MLGTLASQTYLRRREEHYSFFDGSTIKSQEAKREKKKRENKQKERGKQKTNKLLVQTQETV